MRARGAKIAYHAVFIVSMIAHGVATTGTAAASAAARPEPLPRETEKGPLRSLQRDETADHEDAFFLGEPRGAEALDIDAVGTNLQAWFPGNQCQDGP